MRLLYVSLIPKLDIVYYFQIVLKEHSIFYFGNLTQFPLRNDLLHELTLALTRQEADLISMKAGRKMIIPKRKSLISEKWQIFDN